MKASLIICSYGRPAQLKTCLAALDTNGLAMHGSDLVLVHTLDDPATAEVIAACAASSGFPVKIAHTTRRGLSIARNAGIKSAGGDLLIFTDDDCVMPSGYIGAIVTEMSSGPYGYGGGNLHIPGHHAPGTGQIAQKTILKPGTLIHAGVISGANMFFRRDVFERLGGFREDMGAGSGTAFVGAEDLEMVTRASLGGYTGLLIPDALITHAHNRKPGSLEDIEVARGYAVSRGAHYAWLMMRGIHESWSLWSGTATPDQNRLMTRETLDRLRQEFEGASKYLEYCLQNNVDLPPGT